jgi:hypothetical protein
MIKTMLGTMCLVVFGASLAMTQTNDHPDAAITNWGKSVQGVQMSISTTNSGVVERGTAIILKVVIRNSSTNAIHMGYTGLASDYDAILIDVTGKTYHLIDPPIQLRLNTTLTINPGEQNIQIIQVTIKKNIEPGDYTLQAARRFYVDNDWLDLESNPLTVQIK